MQNGQVKAGSFFQILFFNPKKVELTIGKDWRSASAFDRVDGPNNSPRGLVDTKDAPICCNGIESRFGEGGKSSEFGVFII